MRVAFSMERTGGAAEDTTQCYIIGVILCSLVSKDAVLSRYNIL